MPIINRRTLDDTYEHIFLLKRAIVKIKTALDFYLAGDVPLDVAFYLGEATGICFAAERYMYSEASDSLLSIINQMEQMLFVDNGDE